jgi:Pyruvate/2-oxoacid:ferredoxin oxidoreductase delta subunit
VNILRRKKLWRLARLMSRQNTLRVPITRAVIDCFDFIIRPRELDFLLELGTSPCTYAQAARRANMSEVEFSRFFDTLLGKGLVWPRYPAERETTYALAPFMVGWFELQLGRGLETFDQVEFARRIQNAYMYWQRFNVFPLRLFQNLYFLNRNNPHQSIAANLRPETSGGTQKIDIQQKIHPPPDRVYPVRRVHHLIASLDGKPDIALMHCFCRQWHKMVGDPCRFEYPPESCLAIGPITEYIVRYGFGRYITRQKALDLITTTHKAGAVHTVFYEGGDLRRTAIGICSCCWDCCGILGSFNRGVIPVQLKSYYRARVLDPAACIQCGLCETYCPTAAVRPVRDGVDIRADRCIGCGQCVGKCPKGVIALEPDERVVKLPLLKKNAVRISGG